jgi:anti-sigma28 factor (negative regulator of flagellin synthesis)
MQISLEQVKMAQEMRARAQAEAAQAPAHDDTELVAEVVQNVIDAPDREARIAELKARIDAGEYNLTGDEIAEAMMRRAVADRLH